LTSQAARFPGVLSAASTVAEAIFVGVPEILLRSSPAAPVPSMVGAVPAVAVSASAVLPVSAPAVPRVGAGTAASVAATRWTRGRGMGDATAGIQIGGGPCATVRVSVPL
jgi:hypothetical protein